MKSQNGITITTLTIYIIVATILLGTLSFVNANFMSELGELTEKSKLTNESIKFYSFFVEDIKSANSILEFSEDYLRLDNGVQYFIKYRANDKTEAGQTYNVYEIYRNDTLITDKFSGAFFDYNPEGGYVNVRTYATQEENITTNEQYFKVGRGY